MDGDIKEERQAKFKIGDFVEVWTMSNPKIQGRVTAVQLGGTVNPFSEVSVSKFWYQVDGSGLYAENLLSEVEDT